MAVDQPAARNATIELGGPDKVSPNAVVKLFETTTGQPFKIDYVPVEALQAQKAAASDPLQQSFAGLMLAYANGDPIAMQQTLKLFPLTPTSVKDYASRVLAAAR
jgi:uncharacterized protein YbjT (DUF2867 family)